MEMTLDQEVIVQRATRYVSGVLIVGTMVSSTVPRTASAQGAKPDACQYMDAAQMLQLTGRKDELGRGPQKMDPAAIPSYTSGCDFLGVMLVLNIPFTAQQFASERASIEKIRKHKSQSVSGVGDDAFVSWDPRPGSLRSVHLSFRSGNKRISLEDMVPPDSIETAKKWLTAFAKTAASRAK
jgi:hypothetical protein